MQLFLAAAEEGVVNPLPVPALTYGIAIFASLMFLLLAMMSLRSVAHRHEPTESAEVAETQQGTTASSDYS